MKALHVIEGLSRDSGGPARSVQGLVAAECAAGADAWLWSINGGESWVEGVRVVGGVASFSSGETPLSLCQFDVVHLHGIWSWKLHRVAAMCRKAGVKYVIAPRGMLEPWSLKQKWLKKRIARWLYQDRDLKLAAALHATAESEAEQFRRLGFKNKIIVSPNGVNVPAGTFEVKARGAIERSEIAEGLREQRRALFVSRMHPKKGVLELVESWARVKNEVKVRGAIERSEIAEGLRERWICELVYTMNSVEERAYEQKVKDRILALGMTYSEGQNSAVHLQPSPSPKSPDFLFTGPLDDEKKWEAYGRADLFVLPTYSENFGIVVAEALWAGVPVITTKGTPWAELECSASSKFKVQSSRLEERCGWWIELPEAEGSNPSAWPALDNALSEAMVANDLREMGARGRKLVEARYTWAAVCDKMIKGYEEVLNGRT